MVDNFDKIAPLLDFGGELDFYFVSLILRKKDQTTTYGNKNNSARIIKNYHFFNLEQFREKEIEIKALCEEFGCRAGFYLNRRNLKVISLRMLVKLATNIESGNWNCLGLLGSTLGEKYSTDRIKFLDCDSFKEYRVLKKLLQNEKLRPQGVDKILAEIPTNSGYHLVTSRFDVEAFKTLIEQEEDFEYDYKQGEQLVNPVALYYPKRNDKHAI